VNENNLNERIEIIDKNLHEVESKDLENKNVLPGFFTQLELVFFSSYLS